MTVDTFLAEGTAALQQAGVESGRLDCLILLEDLLTQDRARVLAHLDLPLNTAHVETLQAQIAQRAQHIPLAYIRGRAAFYGRDFAVTDAVLVPRPETETMITMLKNLPLPTSPRIADIGTGSGCIGITAQLELPAATVYLYDIDDAALTIAARNATTLRAAVHLSKADVLNGVTEAFDVVLANLPYVPDAYPINEAARHEPARALFAGEDGLDLYRALWEQLSIQAHQPSIVLTEALPIQHGKLAALARAAGFTPTAGHGLIQQFEKR